MARTTELKWKPLRAFLEGYLQVDASYRAGVIYEAYIRECDTADISRKDFEMFLRDQVMKDDGLLKRISHGVYEKRTNPADRGVLFTRGTNKTNQEISFDEILDESVELNMKVNTIFANLNQLESISIPAQMELKQLKNLLLQKLDNFITDITAMMSWCEDNMDMVEPDETGSMKLGGM